MYQTSEDSARRNTLHPLFPKTPLESAAVNYHFLEA